MFHKNQILELTIHDLSINGSGVSKTFDIPIFIENTAIGEKIKAQIYDYRKTFALAQLIEIIEPAECRIVPLCNKTVECGGCTWQHINYPNQLSAKENIIKNTLKHIADIDEIQVNDIIGSNNEFGYRNKSQFVVKKNHNTIEIGFYKKNSHHLVNVDNCEVIPQDINLLIEKARIYLNEINLSVYDESTNHGLIRHIVTQYSFFNKTILITLVLNNINTKSINTVDLNKLQIFQKKILKEFQNITGIIYNFNEKPGNKILGDYEELAFGQDFIIERLISHYNQSFDFTIKSNTFFQINNNICQKLYDYIYKIVFEIYQNKNELNIIDAYGGFGTISMWLSKLAKKIICIESNKKSHNLFNINCENNNIKNTEFINAKVENVLSNIITKKSIDIIVLDPPRKGLEGKTIDAILHSKIKNLIYVSCNPSTLARDLKILCNKSNNAHYIIREIQPFDMFCQTNHIETLVNLSYFQKDS